MNTAYLEKLRSPLWQRKRLAIFTRDNWTCVCCGRSDLPLHVHHLIYLPGLEPWEYQDHSLITYCEICHNTEHLIGNQLQESLLEIIKNNTLLIKPVAELCVLCEKFDGFGPILKKFLKDSMQLYLETKTNVESKNVA